MHPSFPWCAGPAAAHGVTPLEASARAPDPADEPDPLHRHLRAARDAAARGDLGGALSHFDDALRLAPCCGMAHLGRAMCLGGLGRTEEASRALRDALEAGDPSPHLALQLSRLAAREGRADLAMDLLGHALEAEPDLGARVLADPAYRPLRDHPRLLAMLGHL